MRTRQNLSSDSLFHFIDKKDFLIDILTNGFQARYCLESFPKLNIPLAYPMKCFCDIPLGVIKRHMADYGRFGVGISKNFARRMGITPVIYVHDNSQTLLHYLNDIATSKKGGAIGLIPYLKRYDEKISARKSKIVRRYYDEREWRYVPRNSVYIDLRKLNSSLAAKAIEKANESLTATQYKLKFQADDLTYIFVEKNDDVLWIIKELKSTKRFQKPNNTVDLIISRIITGRQIERDF